LGFSDDQHASGERWRLRLPLVAGKAWHQSATVRRHGCVLGGSRQHGVETRCSPATSAWRRRWPIRSTAPRRSRRAACGAGVHPGRSASVEWVFEKMAKAQPGSISLALELADWRCERASLKRYPIQYALQAPVEAAVELHGKLKGRLDQIVGIVATMKPAQLATLQIVKVSPRQPRDRGPQLPPASRWRSRTES